ncbi:MAG: hypothetical protein ACYC6Y_20945, partial [Thermoguttaceae bacterium]
MSEFSGVTSSPAPADRRSGGELPDSDGQNRVQTVSEALVRGRAAVAEYLRDLWLRDPDAIARESLRILDQALAEATGSEQIDGSKLSERAIRLT